MKNLNATLLFAILLIVSSCKKEEESSLINYETGREIAQSLNMMLVCIQEADRIIANEYDVCPLAVDVTPVQASSGIRYEATYGEGCMLPNGLDVHGTFKVTEFIDDPATGLRRRLIDTDNFAFDTATLSGFITMMEQSPGHWNVFWLAGLQYGSTGNLRFEGYPKAQKTAGLETQTVTDDTWSISVDSLFIKGLYQLETYASTEPGSPLQGSSLCAWLASGNLNINNGDALIRFGDGACDNTFWLEWSSGAAVQISF